jgi:hypothetical protein
LNVLRPYDLGEMRAMMAEAEGLHAALVEAIVGGCASGPSRGGGGGGGGGNARDDREARSGGEYEGDVRVVVGAAADSSQLHYRKK